MAKRSNVQVWVFVALILIAGIAIYASSFSGNVIQGNLGAKGPPVHLVAASQMTFLAGESFTLMGKGQYAGQTLTMTVQSIFGTGPTGTLQAKLILTDPTGSVIGFKNVKGNQLVEFKNASGVNAFQETLFLENVAVDPSTNTGFADVAVGMPIITFVQGDSFVVYGSGPYSGRILTVTVSGVGTMISGGNVAKFDLYDPNGNRIGGTSGSIGVSTFTNSAGTKLTKEAILITGFG